jgi:ankyrin repeat protein
MASSLSSAASSCSSSSSFVFLGRADEEIVPGEEVAVRAWLKKQGFQDGDLHGAKYMQDSFSEMTPMGRSCQRGQLNVCRWLHERCGTRGQTEEDASSSIIAKVVHGRTPMHWACHKGHLSVCQWLFDVGAAADVTKAANNGSTPMLKACDGGHLSVCKWLFEVGAAKHITKANKSGYTPMFVASHGGHLSVCKWLFEVGAASDITQEAEGGETPMFVACLKGHLPVCEWLFEVGAAEDITRAQHNGNTPMFVACRDGRLSVCQWLVFNGATNFRPTTSSSSSDPSTSTVGHVDQAVVHRDTRLHGTAYDLRPDLLRWAQDVVVGHHIFLHVVLRASVILPDFHQQVSPDQRCHLPRLPRAVLERLGVLLDVEMGRRLCNVREFAEALETVLVNESNEDEAFLEAFGY